MVITLYNSKELAWEQGIEPQQSVLEALVLPLNYTHLKLVEKMGIEPTTDRLQGVLAPMEHASPFITKRIIGEGWRIRTTRRQLDFITGNGFTDRRQEQPSLLVPRVGYDPTPPESQSGLLPLH